MTEFLKYGGVEGEYLSGRWLIGYACDIEGNYKYWLKYVGNSKILHRGSDGKLELRENAIFIHGGDVCDRGNGDLRVLRDLLDLKLRYNDRVFFIIGNRDANKFRLPVALCDGVIAHQPHCYWFNGPLDASYRVGNKIDKIKWVLKNTMGAPFAFDCRAEELKDLRHPTNSDPANENQVCQSFLQLALPGGLLFDYIKKGHMAVLIEDTLFVHGAVTSLNNIVGYVPPQYNREKDTFIEEQRIANVKDWVPAINNFLQSEVEDYERNIASYVARLNGLSSWDQIKPLCWDSQDGYRSKQPAARLIQTGMAMLPDEKKSPNPGIVYASYLVNGKPNHLDEPTANWLKNGGVKKVVVGHQPNADAPLILDDFGVMTISNDSSYSKFTLWKQRDLKNLGKRIAPEKVGAIDESNETWINVDKFRTDVLTLPAPSNSKPSEKADTRNDYHVNEVILTFAQRPTVNDFSHHKSASNSSSLVMHGTTSMNVSYFSSPDRWPAIGKTLGADPDAWQVKVGLEIEGNQYYLLSQSEKFDFRNKLMSKADVEANAR